MTKLWIELKRRGWVVILTAAVVVGLGALASASIKDQYSDEVVLVAAAGGRLAKEPDASSRLAATYAKLLPDDGQVEAAIADALGGTDGWTLAVTNDPNSAVLRLLLEAEDAGTSERGARAAVDAITGPAPDSPNIQPRSLSVLAFEQVQNESQSGDQILLVAVILGLMAGIVIVVFWRRRDARVDTLAELREAGSVPCFELPAGPVLEPSTLPLVRAQEIRPAESIALVPCRRSEEGIVESMAAVLRGELRGGPVEVAAAPLAAGGAELIAVDSELSVLVVGAGTKAATVRETLAVLQRQGASVGYAILVHGRIPSPRPAARVEA